MPGLFITFEGIDRSGKSTQAKMLCDALGDGALLVREPGGTPTGERIRELLKDPDLNMTGNAEAALFAAARAELVETVIKPALAGGRIVVCDRYVDSSLAYQGLARGLGVKEITALNRWATSGLQPDLTLLLDVPLDVAGNRDTEDDRFTQEGAFLQRKVHSAYELLYGAGLHRWRKVNADRDPHDVHQDVMTAVEDAMNAALPAGGRRRR
jgi:dTMP kinase